MVMVRRDEDEKSRIVNQICEVSVRANACADQHRSCGKRSPFIDWYIVLGVDESADIDGIKRQYHNLALVVHPDKNKHSKAESAFKLVSQAYLCLSDSERRREFDKKRKGFSCGECRSSKRGPDPDLRRRIGELRNKLREEMSTIEKCMVVNASLRRSESSSGRRRMEMPVFNPSDYRGETHCSRSINYKKVEELKRCVGRKSQNGSPIFQPQPGRRDFMINRLDLVHHQ